MIKKTGIFTALLMAAILVMPLAVHAVEAPPAGSSYGTLQMEIRYVEGETPNVPQTITRFGSVYYLVSQTAPVLEDTLPLVRTYTYTIVGAVTQAQLDEIEGLGDEVVFTKVEIPLGRTVDKFEPPMLMPTNDVDAIDTTKEYFVSDLAPDGDGGYIPITTGQDFELTGVTFEPVDEPADGLPDGYMANAVYRGVETYLGEGYSVEGSFETKVNEGEADVYVIVAGYQTDATTLSPIVDTVFVGGGGAAAGGGAAGGGVAAGGGAGAGADAAVTPPVDIGAGDVPADAGATVETVAEVETPQGTVEGAGTQNILPFVIVIACILAVLFFIQSMRRRRKAAEDRPD